MTTQPTPTANGDEAAVPSDLASAINAARAGEATDEHIGTMLSYLVRDAAEIATLRTQLAQVTAELAKYERPLVPVEPAVVALNDRLRQDRDALAEKLEKAEQRSRVLDQLLEKVRSERDAALSRAVELEEAIGEARRYVEHVFECAGPDDADSAYHTMGRIDSALGGKDTP